MDESVKNPGIDLWNAVRGREGTETGQVRSQVDSVDSTTLVNMNGQAWQQYRMDTLIPNAAIVLGLVLLAIVVFRLVRGKIPIRAGRSTHKIKRFSTFQRYVHWTTAILFVALSITGVVLLFGRYVVIPVFGAEIGGTLTWLFKSIHDYAGPAFAVALVVLVVTFIKGNLPNLSDLKWLAKGGGLFGGHASAGRYNAGEKGWYWTAAIVGAFVVVSGLVMDFPNFGQGRDTMTYYHWIHSISAVIVMAFAMGHIYMGTIAMEGAFEVMQTGYCDANWAKEHHDEWYAEMQQAGEIEEGSPLPRQVNAEASPHPNV
ncbi:formate dehydrogenase subunit gamma [Thiothrix subterranea]|uniref:Formate dehydrogenase subunit gamma n=1 Tax=Thiothrix subterranea TaxID=2735563 RepID=A0AA51MPJ5_9GAMM|nr:formate dehydrogenase subunit gamma [Thiothrix subterranea]MDQ5770709.1 formate dehydrogenase subunit gamma [Thiothrix subterranea]WML87733.1 formate dehydrogenase subunit gamma [Thiothrix subterranea]